MNKKIEITSIGRVKVENHQYSIQLDKQYIPALKNIDGFSHLQVVWWGSMFGGAQYRNILTSNKPYKKGPDVLGIFATRSPVRPNPILISNVAVLSVDFENGIISVPYIDAENGTPVLDIKPYHLSERVKDCSVPEWCAHWPKWEEESAGFDWQNEFNF
jgi:tRNA (Thr-GGU) A37 N-methylase